MHNSDFEMCLFDETIRWKATKRKKDKKLSLFSYLESMITSPIAREKLWEMSMLDIFTAKILTHALF